jgi:hypothetical protein
MIYVVLGICFAIGLGMFLAAIMNDPYSSVWPAVVGPIGLVLAMVAFFAWIFISAADSQDRVAEKNKATCSLIETAIWVDQTHSCITKDGKILLP